MLFINGLFESHITVHAETSEALLRFKSACAEIGVKCLYIELDSGAHAFQPMIGATQNTTGALTLRADKVGADSLLARIVQLVSQAQRSRAPLQRLADKVAGWFVGGVVTAAVLTLIAWGMLGPEPAWLHGFVNAVAVLIIACPCALGLATPMSIMVGVGAGARAGVLVKSAEALERMEKVDILVIDKTGTLTEGHPSLTGIETPGMLAESDLLRLAASVEALSEHPLAHAIVSEAKMRGLALDDVREFDSPVGKGARGMVGGRLVAIGQERFLGELGIVVPPPGRFRSISSRICSVESPIFLRIMRAIPSDSRRMAKTRCSVPR